VETKNSGINFDVNRRRNCIECQKEVETLEHLATNCTKDTRNNKRMNQILGEKGEGISWMKKILRLRKENKTKKINLEVIEIN